MIKGHIDIYFFTGTGNTLIAARKMVDTFHENGVKATLHRMENADPMAISESGTIGLAFPVAIQGTFPFVWDFVRAMPNANDTPVFMLDTMMLFSGGIIGPLGALLRKKGYKTIGAKEIFMPMNLFPAKEHVEKNAGQWEKGIARAEKYALDLMNGKTRWGRIPVLSELMGMWAKMDAIWKMSAHHYDLSIDEKKCNDCGICARICPTGNITLAPHPVYADKCLTCMRCITFCPQQAIYSKKKPKAFRYRAITLKELMEYK